MGEFARGVQSPDGGRVGPVYLTEEEVKALLADDPSFSGLVDTVEDAFLAYSRGELSTPDQERMRVVWPPRATVRPYDRDIRIHAAMVPTVGAAGIHIGCGSKVPGLEGKTSFNVLMDYQTMAPLAIIEDSYLHSIRSGLPTGVGVRHLAKPDARVLGVIGCGKISRVQLAVAVGQRPIDEIRVFSRRAPVREAFAKEHEAKFGIRTVACATPEEVVDGADIVVCATNSYNDPVFDGRVLKEGALVVAVTPGEVDAHTALRGRCVVSSLNRLQTDYTPQEPIASLIKGGRIAVDDLSSLGGVLSGEAPGRIGEEVIFFYSPGIGFLDVIVGKHVYDLAVGR